jgi:signal peptidase II
MNNRIGFWIITFVILLDQATKVLVWKSALYLPIHLTPFLDIVLTYNKGISFGILNASPRAVHIGLIVVNIMVTAYLVHLGRKMKDKPSRIALYLIIGGAIGNIIDRLWNGAVIDFLDFYIFNYHWYTFNIADSAIVIGAAILMWRQFTGKLCASS